MKNLFKPALVLTPAIFALAACDTPPAEDPTADTMETEGELVENPLETGPMDEALPTEGGLEGGAISSDEIGPETDKARPPTGEKSMMDENNETPDATGNETTSE
ncbi:MAG: hypothetical protein V7676_07505 [Parasphingorhabdus sp.]|uniref:hypothetical protein n=1 Tax=Parasphingorhabdus sp. TaxID=2709688 RepID=UPI00300119FA